MKNPLIDSFVSYVMSKKNNGYLRFDPNASCSLPKSRNESQRAVMMYMHIPFCEELCTYCSFNRTEYKEDLAIKYFAALEKEILLYKQEGYNFQSVYIGGGTPTVLMPKLLDVITLLKNNFSINEISVETNPNHLDESHMLPLKEMGVNRLSVGIQSFDDDILKATGRYHKYGSSDEIKERILKFKDYFPTFNIDMMFNFPIQTDASLKQDLDIIQDLNVNQVTYYPLMLSRSTSKQISDTMGVVNNKRSRVFYKLISDTLGKKYDPATAWCFNHKDSNTKMVDEYVINYDEYVGAGSGSIGYLGGSIYANTFDIADYIKMIAANKFPISARRDCSKREQLLYDFLMQFFGLSLDLDKVSKTHGVNAALWLFPEILFFMLIGGIGISPQKNILKVKDRYYWVCMMREFFTSVNNFRDYCRK